MTDMIEVSGVVLACAVRYALGRRSYITGSIADEVQRCWPTLSANIRAVIQDDVCRHCNEADDVEPTWSQLRSWMAVQP